MPDKMEVSSSHKAATRRAALRRESLLVIAAAVILGGVLALAGSQHGVYLGSSRWPVFAVIAGLIFLVQWLIFLPSWLAQTEHYFDLTGSATYLGAVLGAALLAGVNDMRSLLLLTLVTLWALRLGSFLFLRVKRQGADTRFDEIKPSFSRFLMVWTMQGLWVLITAGAALAAISSTHKPPVDALLWLGVALWLAGFAIEVTADAQKTAFSRNPDNKGRFIQHGLWAWSRHPNYFGEIILWCGIALIALPALQGWQLLTLISPLFVAVLLTRVSGIPMLEARAEQRWGHEPDYRAWHSRTPALIPRKPRSQP
jgi:steroid 5-alpha reductase family enzyme